MNSLMGGTIGEYALELPLGKGALGQTYRARQAGSGRAVVVKVVDARLAADAGFRARFEQAASAAAALSGATGAPRPDIVAVHGFGEWHGHFWLAMDFLPDGSLRTLLERRAELLPLARGVTLVRQAADALAFAHRQGVLHRDVKPENLLLRRDPAARETVPGSVVVADFGLTRLAESGVTIGGDRAIGSPPYMSPEQRRGGALDARSDVYSLGVVLYEVVTGFPPFQVKTVGDAVAKHVAVAAPAPRSIVADLPAALEAVVLRCLAKRPDDRFQSAATLSEALAGVLASLGEQHRLARVVLGTPGPHVVLTEPDARPDPAAEPASRLGATRRFRVRLDDAGGPPDAPPARPGRVPMLPLPRRIPVLRGPGDGPARPLGAADPVDGGATPRRILVDVPRDELPRDPATERAGPAAAADSRRIRVVLDADVLALTPGVSTVVQVTVANGGTTVDHFVLGVDGVPETWVRGPTAPAQLNPGERTTVALHVLVPRTPEGRAGTYPIVVRARSHDRPAESGSATATWTVLPFAAYTVTLAPSRGRGWRRAALAVRLQNGGNTATRLALAGADEEHAFRYRFEPAEVTLEPGAEASAALRVRAPLRWIGSSESRPFTVRAAPIGAIDDASAGAPAVATAPQLTGGLFVQRPLVPLWLPPLLLAAGVALFLQARAAREARQLAVVVSPARLPVARGTTARLRAAVSNRAGEAIDGQPIAWSVEDTAVATVSADGVVRGRTEGLTVVTASIGGRSATAEVQVMRPVVQAVALAPGRLSLKVGDAAALRATPRDAGGVALASAVMWTSSDPSVVTVGGNGRVVAKGPGSATITAQSEGALATSEVSVAALPTAPVAVAQGAGVPGAAGAGGGAPAAQCVAYDAASLRVADAKSAGWVVTDGSTNLLLLDNETDARRALALAKRHKAHCFLGRENGRPNRSDYVIEYWEGASGVATRIDVEDCIPLDRPALRIADLGAAGWVLADNRARLLSADSRDDARRAWEIAQRSTALCFIGRGNARSNQRDYLVQYWR